MYAVISSFFFPYCFFRRLTWLFLLLPYLMEMHGGKTSLLPSFCLICLWTDKNICLALSVATKICDGDHLPESLSSYLALHCFMGLWVNLWCRRLYIVVKGKPRGWRCKIKAHMLFKTSNRCFLIHYYFGGFLLFL